MLRHAKRRGASLLLVACCFVLTTAHAARADRLRLTDGTTVEADEVWDDAQSIWYRQGGVTYSLERARVRSVERGAAATPKRAAQVARLVNANFSPVAGAGATSASALSSLSSVSEAVNPVSPTSITTATAPPVAPPIWIYFVGGARVEVDEATEAADGVWYKRNNLSIFVERARIERIERERPETLNAAGAGVAAAARRERGWSTGRPALDSLIRQNGARYNVDPYLIFCVMEQESHFNPRALSPVGARGLMQLMPGTAARFGVRNSHDPAQNVAGGTRYLKLLLERFDRRVDLVLASYNAGEGAVMKYGQRVPPYRETRNYVQRISYRYGSSLAHAPAVVAVSAAKMTASAKTNAIIVAKK